MRYISMDQSIFAWISFHQYSSWWLQDLILVNLDESSKTPILQLIHLTLFGSHKWINWWNPCFLFRDATLANHWSQPNCIKHQVLNKRLSVIKSSVLVPHSLSLLPYSISQNICWNLADSTKRSVIAVLVVLNSQWFREVFSLSVRIALGSVRIARVSS